MRPISTCFSSKSIIKPYSYGSLKYKLTSRCRRPVYSLRPGETPEQALERRRRESERVEERIKYVTTSAEFDDEMTKAGNKLVVLEVHSERICQTGLEEEAELHWKDDVKASLAPCAELKHVFQRTARDCPDVVFLNFEADGPEASALADRLGIEILPTLQFYRAGKLLWEHKGHLQLNQDLGEGVLFFGDIAGNNVKASDYVTDLRSKVEFEEFIANQKEGILTVIDISLSNAGPCLHIFPAVLALAKSFVGYAAFARVMADDDNEDLQRLMQELNVIQVPTFLFYRNGQAVGRHVGSSRGDLIGQILAQQSAAGIAPPPPPPGSQKRQRGRSAAGKR